jgi:large subunit ribosomal protein L10
MPTPTKVEKVREIKERLEGSAASLISDYRGITVKDVTELRAALREAEATFTVVKNTLTKLAAADAGLAELQTILEGPTAITFVQGDVVVAAKRLADAAKRIPSLEIKGGVMEGRVLSAEQARALATLESREVLLAKMAGMAKASLSRAASAFVAVQSRFLAVLDAYKEKVPPGEAPADESLAPAEAGPGETAAADEAGDQLQEAVIEGLASAPAGVPDEPAERMDAEQALAEELSEAPATVEETPEEVVQASAGEASETEPEEAEQAEELGPSETESPDEEEAAEQAGPTETEPPQEEDAAEALAPDENQEEEE